MLFKIDMSIVHFDLKENIILEDGGFLWEESYVYREYCKMSKA
jgi:hypothetical protein